MVSTWDTRKWKIMLSPRFAICLKNTVLAPHNVGGGRTSLLMHLMKRATFNNGWQHVARDALLVRWQWKFTGFVASDFINVYSSLSTDKCPGLCLPIAMPTNVTCHYPRESENLCLVKARDNHKRSSLMLPACFPIVKSPFHHAWFSKTSHV